jgi:hypothetical protein
MGWRRGRGRGWGWPWAPAAYGAFPAPPPLAPEQELAALRQQADAMGRALQEVQSRIAELEKEPAS